MVGDKWDDSKHLLDVALARPTGVLATIGRHGHPHVVPCVFALVGAGTIVTAVDEKPKSTRRLARVRNIEKDPRVSMLIDRYDDDWTSVMRHHRSVFGEGSGR